MVAALPITQRRRSSRRQLPFLLYIAFEASSASIRSINTPRLNVVFGLAIPSAFVQRLREDGGTTRQRGKRQVSSSSAGGGVLRHDRYVPQAVESTRLWMSRGA